MRLLHVSDTHLGFRQYSRLAREDDGAFAGLNQREVDVYVAWRWAVDLAIEKGVDVVVHAGDLFDAPRPSNRALAEAIEGIKRLGDAGIRFVVVAGNHSTPRLRQTGSVFRVLEHLTNAHAIYRGYGSVIIDGVAFHGVPHAYDDALRDEMVARLVRDPAADRNVAVLHCFVSGVGQSHYAEISQMVVDDGALPRDFDYIALGHLHQHHAGITGNGIYSGSLERFSFSEVKDAKGAVLVDLDAGSREFVVRETRPMLSVDIDCTRRGYEDIENEAAAAIDSAPDGALLRVRLRDIARAEYRSIDLKGLRARGDRLLHLEIAQETAAEAASSHATGPVNDIVTEFEAFLAVQPIENADRAELLRLGRELLTGGGPE
ncbi:MAG: exonuclease SbcCD subunit D [Thermoplasmata archaeon]|nr:exonuclease SbcCD subunit D [Thermoplasmata archaeon]